MTRKPPTGAKHAPCRDHVAHPYMSNGYLCVTTHTPDELVAFADHLVATVAEHRAAELVRQSIPAMTAADYLVPVDFLSDGRAVKRVLSQQHDGGSSHLPMRSACSHTPHCAEPLPAEDTYAAAVARTAAAAPVKARKARPVKVAVATVASEPVPDALSLCNSCDMRPADPDSAAGYCTECEPVEWSCADCDGRAYPMPVVSHAIYHEPEPVQAPAVEPCPYKRLSDACTAGDVGHTGPHDFPPLTRCTYWLHRLGGPVQCTVGIDKHPGEHEYPPAIEPELEPEPAAPVLVAEPVTTSAAERPTCERCGQVFRKHGTGAEWHRLNRLDCAGAVVAPVVAG